MKPLIRIVTSRDGDKMKLRAALLWILGCCLAGSSATLNAQGQNGENEQPSQSNAPQQSPTGGNPFPEDEKNVPVMPSGSAPTVTDSAAEANDPDAAPARDSDPVRSPEGMAPGGIDSTAGFSSSRNGLDNINADADTDTTSSPKGKKGGAADVIPHETAKEDIDVGNYYMDNKNWKGALSRFQSAMVLAPDNPDAYWGLAECYRRMGRYAEARANYEKVVKYDPDSKHGKDAKKALKDSDLANAVSNPAQK